MNVTHLRYIALAVPDYERSRVFFGTGWGLRETAATGDRAFFATQSGEAFQLALVSGSQRKIERIAFGLATHAEVDRATAFYCEVLGFRVSDWSEHVMSFLRCNREHHALAFNAAPHAAYNHTSWTMDSIDALFRAQGRLRSAGAPLRWGTGRHGPGSQVFNYYVEPSGFVVELIADGVEIPAEESWVPQVWERKPEFMDLWGTAGPPSEELRAAMAGTPDPGYEVERV